jgi:predicted DNA-binding transcriptional regulator YafY
MRASRLVTLLLLLQTRGHLTAGQLADELEVSVRTVLRDVDALAEAGVPIYSERGPHGGIRLVEGYRTRLTGLTGEEAEAIFMSGLPGPAAELGLGTVVAAARLKVLAALPPELRARAARLVERFHLDASGWFQADEAVPHLGPLSEAVWEGRRVEIDYERGDRIVTRALEPMGLVLKAGVWYVIARTDDQMRTYRASRVTRVAVLDDRFERPEGFDLAGFWAEASSAYERGTPRVEVTVRVRSERLERLEDAAGRRTVAEAERLPETDADGWLRLRLRLDWPLEVPLLLLRAGPDIEVLDPPEIRSRVAELARRVADRYGVGISETGPAPASPGSA